MNSVSRNIKKLRLAQKITQEEMAQKLFVTRQTVSNWEIGKSQPDIDTLIKIAETFNTDATELIYGPPDSAAHKREKRRLIVACGILLLLGIGWYVMARYAAEAAASFILQPKLLMYLYVLPAFWLVLGWTAPQGLSVLGALKPLRFKFSKTVHIASLAIAVLYFALMLPLSIDLFNSMAQLLQYRHAPSLYPDGYQYTSIIPGFLYRIYLPLINAATKFPALFVVFGALAWLIRPLKQEV